MDEHLSSDIKTSLTHYAHSNRLPIEEVDFTLKAVASYSKSYQDPNYEPFTQEDKKRFSDLHTFINNGISLKQRYKIQCFKRAAPAIQLEYTIAFDAYNTVPILTILPSSTYSFTQRNTLYKQLLLEVNKIKAYHHILIGIANSTMHQQLKTLVTRIMTSTVTEPFAIHLFEGIAPTIATASTIKYYFDTKAHFVSVHANEKLLTYTKPTFASNGFNAFGQLLHAENTFNVHAPKIINSEHIAIVDTKKHLHYISKISGIIKYSNHQIDIVDELHLQTLSRNQPPIKTDEQSNVTLTIDQRDATHDTIGEGVTLRSETIDVAGYVGAHTTLEANTLTIHGATHQSTKLFAHSATIHRHKGTLRAHSATVTTLEGGHITAREANVETMIGGEVIASSVTIETIHSHCQVSASSHIAIHTCKGHNNTITIDYRHNPIIKAHLTYLEDEITRLKDKKRRTLAQHTNELTQLTHAIELHKQTITNYELSALNATVTLGHLKHPVSVTFVTPDNQSLTHTFRPNDHQTNTAIEIRLKADATHYTLMPCNTRVKKRDLLH